MPTKDNVGDMIFVVACVFSFMSSGILVEDSTVEDDWSIVTSLLFELELSEADKGGFCNLKMAFGTIASE